MNSNRSSIVSSSRITPRAVQRQSRSKGSILQKARLQAYKKLASKYCTCENYMTLTEINRTIMDKQCILKTTVNDIKYNQPEQKLQAYHGISKTTEELPELIEYYKYYSQKSVLYIKEYFPLLYQYQQKRKIIEYNRLKVILNLSDSQPQDQSPKRNNCQNDSAESGPVNKSRIGISRNFQRQDGDSKRLKGYQGVNILNDLNLSEVSTRDEHEESLLINRLRNNLSKHIGPSKIKNLSIQELDKVFDFQKKDQTFNTSSKENMNFMFLTNAKPKTGCLKTKKMQRQQTNTNTPDQLKQKGLIRRRSAQRNNSCQNLTRVSAPKNPYEAGNSKLRRKKNLSMDNLYTHTSTPYLPEQKRDASKGRKFPLKTAEKDRYFKEKSNTMVFKGPEMFMQSITDLKNRIKKEKQRLMKAASAGQYSSLKRQKSTNLTSINTANQRFTKKNYEKLRQKTTVNAH